jgi:sulfate/thiosulfate-binding protein
MIAFQSRRFWPGLAATALAVVAGCVDSGGDSGELLHVSYDVTRELWREINPQAVSVFEKAGHGAVAISQSHGGSSSQARAVIDGLEADVVSLATWTDVDAIRKQGLIDDGWEDEFPHNASPYHSTIVFLVRKGNPKQIADWPDLVADGVSIVTPNPKTSGNGKLSFLAAWGSVVVRGGSEDEAREYVRQVYEHTPVLESGGRGATTAFVKKKIGDVQLAWENEAWLAVEESGGSVEIVYQPVSIRAEPHVAVVDRNVERHGTGDLARLYVEQFYQPAAQRVFAENHLRPSDPDVLAEFADAFPKVELFGVDAVAANWDEAQGKFFAEGGVFDGLYRESTPIEPRE